MTFRVPLGPHGEWQAAIDVRVPDVLKATPALTNGSEPGGGAADAAPAKDLDAWLGSAPKLSCDWAPMARIYQRSLVDLAALRFFPGIVAGPLPAAALPSFLSIFGRAGIL